MNRNQRRMKKKQARQVQQALDAGSAHAGAGLSDVSAQTSLGNAFRDRGQLDEAIACYRRAVALKPGIAEPHSNLGNALQEMGKAEEAVACLLTALSINPRYAIAHSNLGNAYKDQGLLDKAVECFRKSILYEPGFAAAHNNLGNALADQGHLEEATACFRTALRLASDYAHAHNNAGKALEGQGLLDDAAASLRRAMEATPGYAHAHNNLANVLRRQRRLDDAGACYRSAIAIEPDYANAHFNLGTLLLAQGDLAAGWEEYEWRWRTTQLAADRRAFTQPQWQGEEAGGRTLLVHSEQGFGDTLQFCRYAGMAAARGLRVVMQVQAPLVRLVCSLAGVAHVAGPRDELPPFDLHCPMLSMPRAFGTTLATIPGGTPYLHADEGQVSAWRERLADMGAGGLRVGLVWAGDAGAHSPGQAAMDRRRSLDPALLGPLLGLPGVQVFSLQKTGPALPQPGAVQDFMGEMADFADTAALVANLDLVISVDTAVAHLAGALGKPVWLLDRFDPCWRWLDGRRDSLWYPGLRLYRQPVAGGWGAVLEEVARDLAAMQRPVAPRPA